MTRHLDSTLKRDDWDILILHYLGLDHIGHISGPYSSLIQPKLLEMDDILKKVHSALISKVISHPNLCLHIMLHLQVVLLCCGVCFVKVSTKFWKFM